MYKIMTVNLGGTSTKLSLFNDEKLICEGSIRHTDKELASCVDNNAEVTFRKKVADNWIRENNIDLDSLDAIVVRITNTGGLSKSGGTYCIEGKLRDNLMKIYQATFPKAQHPGFLAYPVVAAILDGRPTPVYAVDPDDLDDFCDIARITGYPKFRRKSGIHNLNHRAVGRKASEDMGKDYCETKLVVAHLGGGVSIASHDHGRIIDGTHGAYGEGPFATNRAGQLPLDQVLNAVESGELSAQEVLDICGKKGGFAALTGLTDMRLIEKKAAEGDENCEMAVRAFIYQVCRFIGAQFAALGCEADAIVLTGGIAYDRRVVDEVTKCVGKLAPALVYPGEEETAAMVGGALRVLQGKEKAFHF